MIKLDQVQNPGSELPGLQKFLLKHSKPRDVNILRDFCRSDFAEPIPFVTYMWRKVIVRNYTNYLLYVIVMLSSLKEARPSGKDAEHPYIQTNLNRVVV